MSGVATRSAKYVMCGAVAAMLALVLIAAGQPAAEARTNYVTTELQSAFFGQDNAKVTNIQLRLAAGHFLTNSSVTGFYGNATKDAVRAFRKSVGMKATDGKKITRSSWRALVKATGAVKLPSWAATRKVDKNCMTGGRVLCVNKSMRKLYYLNHNNVIKTLDARFGCSSTPTRDGVWKIFRMVKHDWSWAYSEPMPDAMYFSGGEAVHYSADFAARGYAGCSHGCVNIRDRKTLDWIYQRIHVGDRAVIYWS